MENVFASTHPLVAHKITKLRSKDTEPKKFRELVRELAGLLAYEATCRSTLNPAIRRDAADNDQRLAPWEKKSVWCLFYEPVWAWWKVFGV